MRKTPWLLLAVALGLPGAGRDTRSAPGPRPEPLRRPGRHARGGAARLADEEGARALARPDGAAPARPESRRAPPGGGVRPVRRGALLGHPVRQAALGAARPRRVQPARPGL